MNRQTKVIWSWLALLSFCFGAGAQQPASAPRQAPLPIVPLLVEYEYAPLHLQQWISGHAQYTMIEAIVGQGATPALQVILTDKDARRVWYANAETQVKSLAQAGKEAHLAAIDYKVVPGESGRQTYGIAFRDRQGQAVRWRFIPASEPSERGAGLTPLAAAPGLRLEYRDLGTLAGEGAAVQVGDQVFEAAPWPERSAPPYFTAYRGSITLGRHIGVLASGTQRWRITAAPDELRVGAEWRLANEHGRERRLQVTARRGDEVTIKEVSSNEAGARGVVPSALEFAVRATADGWAWRSIRLINDAHEMRISFNPELSISRPGAAGGAEVTWQVDQGNHQKIAHGVVRVESQPDGVRLRWQPKAPDWARAKAFETVLKNDAAGYVLEAATSAR